jgi:hypothetical protein
MTADEGVASKVCRWTIHIAVSNPKDTGRSPNIFKSMAHRITTTFHNMMKEIFLMRGYSFRRGLNSQGIHFLATSTPPLNNHEDFDYG